MDTKAFKEELRAFLDEVEHDGTFSSFSHYPNYTNPGLHITNYGTVGLPLATRDAEAIAAICKQSPFGKGSETIIDTSVRKTWELDARDFQCLNPAWKEFLRSLARQTAEDLGVKYPMRCEAYKLLLYENGAFFKAHKDSEKAPGMFATMVLCLPSEHSGGEVVLVRGQEHRVLATSNHSQHGFSRLAWYADVQHEVRPVTSGYRLALTFNLIQNQHQPMQTASALDEGHVRFAGLLEKWNKGFKDIDMLAYPLEHQYTEASLSLRNLKGRDASKSRYMESMCSSRGVYWFLAHLERTTQDEDFYDYEGIFASLNLDNIVTADGSPTDFVFSITEKDILRDDLYADRSPDSEEEGEFTGNEGALNTYRYHDTVCVLLRKDRLFDRLSTRQLRDYTSLKTILKLAKKDMEDQSHETAIPMLVTMLKETLDGILRNRRSYYDPLETPPERYSALFSEVSNLCCSVDKASLPREALRLAMQGLTWSSSSEFIGLVANQASIDVTNGVTDAWDNWFSRQISSTTYNEVKNIHHALRLVEAKLPHSHKESFARWRAENLARLLSMANGLSTSEDVSALVDLVPCISIENYLEIVLPNVLGSIRLERLVAYLARLALGEKNGEKAIRAIIRPTFERSVQLHAAAFKVTLGNLKGSSLTSNFRCDLQFFLTADSLQRLSILDFTMTLGLEPEVSKMLEVMLPELPLSADPFWIHFKQVLAFTEKLSTILEKHKNMMPSSPGVSAFMAVAVQRAHESILCRRPTKPNNWARAARSNCGCTPCAYLNQFLLDPNLSAARFQYSQQIRSHLMSSLPSYDFKLETDKGRLPHTLVVHKTTNEYARLLETWESTIKEANSMFEQLRTPAMKFVLGENYDVLLPHDCTRTRPSVLLGQQPLQRVSASVQNAQISQIAGAKRKVNDIIDLTEEN